MSGVPKGGAAVRRQAGGRGPRCRRCPRCGEAGLGRRRGVHGGLQSPGNTLVLETWGSSLCNSVSCSNLSHRGRALSLPRGRGQEPASHSGSPWSRPGVSETSQPSAGRGHLSPPRADGQTSGSGIPLRQPLGVSRGLPSPKPDGLGVTPTCGLHSHCQATRPAPESTQGRGSRALGFHRLRICF